VHQLKLLVRVPHVGLHPHVLCSDSRLATVGCLRCLYVKYLTVPWMQGVVAGLLFGWLVWSPDDVSSGWIKPLPRTIGGPMWVEVVLVTCLSLRGRK
jgi:hypothetical protein